jgi:hypothetical protein
MPLSLTKNQLVCFSDNGDIQFFFDIVTFRSPCSEIYSEWSNEKHTFFIIYAVERNIQRFKTNPINPGSPSLCDTMNVESYLEMLQDFVWSEIFHWRNIEELLFYARRCVSSLRWHSSKWA